MPPLIQRAYLCIAAGAIAGLLTTILIWAFSEAGMFARLGIPMAPELHVSWLYQRSFWGGLWGPVFIVPLLRHSAQWRRGVLFGIAPGLLTLLVFNPLKDGIGLFGLQWGLAWPLLVLFFTVLWGAVAGWLLDFSGFVSVAAER
jgi:hypothetical protein